MKRVKKNVYAGNVLEVAVYSVTEGKKCSEDLKSAKPRLRFKDDEERRKHREGIVKRRHARSFNATFDPSGLYSTLTFEDRYECHTYDEAKAVRKKWYRLIKRRFPDAVLRIYMGRGGAGGRIHFHMVSMGVPKEWIVENWIYAPVKDLQNLRAHNFYDDGNGGRIDRGGDLTNLADYLFNHWEPEQGGQHYMGSRNFKADDGEEVEETVTKFSESHLPPVPQGYVLVDTMKTTYGYQYYKFVKAPVDGFLPRRTRRRSKGVEDELESLF